jgi:hypothetical protein
MMIERRLGRRREQQRTHRNALPAADSGSACPETSRRSSDKEARVAGEADKTRTRLRAFTYAYTAPANGR